MTAASWGWMAAMELEHCIATLGEESHEEAVQDTCAPVDSTLT